MRWRLFWERSWSTYLLWTKRWGTLFILDAVRFLKFNQLFPVVSYSETLNLIVVASWSSCTWSRPSCSSNECSGGTRGCCMAGRSCWWSYHKYECYRYIPNWLCIWKAQNSGYSIHVHYQTKCLLLGILSIVVLSEKWF